MAASKFTEEWRPVKGWPEYEISSLARIRRSVPARGTRTGRMVKPWLGRNGYLYVALHRDLKKTTVTVHRLVCRAFNGPPPTGKSQVAHFDGSRTNNAPANLRWATPKENAADAKRHGTTRFGGESHSAKYDDGTVRRILDASAKGWGCTRIAAEFGVSAMTAWRIANGRSRGEVGRSTASPDMLQ